MTNVPTYRLIIFAGCILLPATLLVVAIASAMVPTIILAVGVMVVALVDAYRSRGQLQGFRVLLPAAVRVSRDREVSFNLEIENERLTVRRIRLGFPFPQEIYTPSMELTVELPQDQPISSIAWLLKGLKQGRYSIDRCYLKTDSL